MVSCFFFNAAQGLLITGVITGGRVSLSSQNQKMKYRCIRISMFSNIDMFEYRYVRIFEYRYRQYRYVFFCRYSVLFLFVGRENASA